LSRAINDHAQLENTILMISKIPKLFLMLIPIGLLVACDTNQGPGPEIHDTKYIAIGPDGKPVKGQPGDNDCVLDQFIGLTWEVKSDQPGLRDWRNTYSWYDPEEDHGELDYRGKPNGGICAASDCDTAAYVKAVNDIGYCGHKDWRLPSRDELGSISDPRKQDNPPTINLVYFPYTQADGYWSGNDYQFQYDTAWRWSFKTGLDRVDWKASPGRVRLVRGKVVMKQAARE